MKNLKSMAAAILVIMITIIAGCSDTITSSGETGSFKKDESVNAAESKKLPYIETIRVKLSINPQSAYNFNSKTTGFAKFYSIEVNNVTRDENSQCEGIAVYSTDLGKFIECHSSGFELNEIMVKNTGSSALHVEVLLRGLNQKVIKKVKDGIIE